MADHTRSIEVLLVEDNPGHVRLTKEVLKEGNLLSNVTVVGDGVEALSCLRRQGKYEDAIQPDLILLDLNLPKKNGWEVLTEIKADPKLWGIPVIVLTASSADEDILRTYNLHANCYITKPVDLDRLMRALKSIGDS